VFFWMGAYTRELKNSLEAMELAKKRHKEADEAAMARQRVALAKLGTDARHAENRGVKLQVQEHYMAHRAEYKSKDDAAEKMANRLVPFGFRTVRDWLKGLP